MTDVVLERYFEQPQARVFSFLTDPDLVLRWFGPEYVGATRGQLDFTKPGSWHAEMDLDNGRTVMVSGQVLKTNPVDHLSYSWAWHTDGVRGHESTVNFDLAPKGTGSILTLTHQNLPDEDTRKGHTTGWTSSLICFETELNKKGD